MYVLSYCMSHRMSWKESWILAVWCAATSCQIVEGPWTLQQRDCPKHFVLLWCDNAVFLQSVTVLENSPCWCIQGHSHIWESWLLNSYFFFLKIKIFSSSLHSNHVCVSAVIWVSFSDTASQVSDAFQLSKTKSQMSECPWMQLWQQSEQNKTNVNPLTRLS